MAADLLLAVARETDVHRQRIRGRELLRALQQHPELALVVGDAARVGPLVAHRQLERLRLPLVQRRGRLHVEVAVEEDGRLAVGTAGSRDLAERELAFAERRQLGGSAGPADEVAHPFACAMHLLCVGGIGADARDREELAELRLPRLVHGGGL